MWIIIIRNSDVTGIVYLNHVRWCVSWFDVMLKLYMLHSVPLFYVQSDDALDV